MDQLKSRLLSAYVRAREGQKGQGFVEYMMIIGLVALGLAAALIAFRNQLSNALSSVGAGV
jgi:Flp pilus assembly pilin Flp